MAPRAALTPILTPHAHRVVAAEGAHWQRTTVIRAEPAQRTRFEDLAAIDWRGPGGGAVRAFTPWQIVALCLLVGIMALAAWRAPAALTAMGALLGALIFTACTGLRLAGAATSISPGEDPPTPGETPLPIYTILCPAYREAEALPGLVAAIARLDYPRDRIDLKFVLEADDAATQAVARGAGFGQIVLAPAAGPRTKPKALNAALASARGAFITVYDAEDRPDPAQLRAALAAFAADPALGCVQAPLLVDNARCSWIAGQFAAEYAVHFSGVLPFLAAIGSPLPLGGTSNHFRREALADCRGWDPFNVTEDADIGYRLARRGWTHGVIAPPTWEEAPVTIAAWIRQRSRWIKGHLQTWLVMMRDPLAAYRELGAIGFWSMQLMLLGGAAAAFAHLPLAATLIIAAVSPRLDVGAGGWALAVFGYATAALSAIGAAAALRDGRIALIALTSPLYWPLASLAAIRAAAELLFRPHYWAKTAHGLSSRPAVASLG